MTFLATKKSSTLESQQDHLPAFKSFKDLHTTAYSHGLESIYALENVDITTVRRISDYSSLTSTVKNELKLKPSRPLPSQLHFDFGEAFNECMDSYVLEEPIQVLGLAAHSEKCLEERGFSVIKDLLSADLNQLIYAKGMGQGHIDELRQKLRHYTQHRMLYACPTIDFAAWLRSLLGKLNRKKIYVTLEAYQLSQVISLTPIENVEVRRLTLEKRSEWQNEVLPTIQSKRDQVKIDLKRIAQIFLYPWLQRRQGFATQIEIVERLQRLSDEPTAVPTTIDFLNQMFFDNDFAFGYCFRRSAENLFFADDAAYNKFNFVVSAAKSYFYKGSVYYALPELVGLLAKQFARQWLWISEEFMEKTLRATSLFRVRRESCGELVVRLA